MLFGSILVAMGAGPPSPRRTANLETDQLPGRLGAANAVVLQIPLFGLPLEALFLLKRPPLSAALVAAAVKSGAGSLAGKHSRHSSSETGPLTVNSAAIICLRRTFLHRTGVKSRLNLSAEAKIADSLPDDLKDPTETCYTKGEQWTVRRRGSGV